MFLIRYLFIHYTRRRRQKNLFSCCISMHYVCVRWFDLRFPNPFENCVVFLLFLLTNCLLLCELYKPYLCSLLEINIRFMFFSCVSCMSWNIFLWSKKYQNPTTPKVYRILQYINVYVTWIPMHKTWSWTSIIVIPCHTSVIWNNCCIVRPHFMEWIVYNKQFQRRCNIIERHRFVVTLFHYPLGRCQNIVILKNKMLMVRPCVVCVCTVVVVGHLSPANEIKSRVEDYNISGYIGNFPDISRYIPI